MPVVDSGHASVDGGGSILPGEEEGRFGGRAEVGDVGAMSRLGEGGNGSVGGGR